MHLLSVSTVQVLDIVDDKHLLGQCMNSKSLGQRKNCNLPGEQPAAAHMPCKKGASAVYLTFMCVFITIQLHLSDTHCAEVHPGHLFVLLERNAGVLVDLPVLGPKDVDDVQKFAAAFTMDFVAASFVQSADDVR